MQKSKVLIFSSKNLFDVLREGYAFFIMYAVYVIGIVLGVLLFKQNGNTADFAARLFEKNYVFNIEDRFINKFFSSFFEWLPFMLGIFISGTSAVGMAVSPLIIAYKGYCYGIVAGFLYTNYFFNGIIYSLIFIIPSTLIAAFGLFFTGKNSFGFSLCLAKQLMPMPKMAGNMYPQLARYCKKFVLLLLITILSALINALFYTSFGTMVKLT